MIEAFLCSLVTLLPDFLYRRFAQGRRLGREITLFSVWYELRWGITAWVMLTLSLITVIFYFHPSTTNAAAFFRAVPILPDRAGRVAEVMVGYGQSVQAGDPLFRLDDADERAAVETARRRVAEIEAAIAVAGTELAAADGRITQADFALRQALEDLDTRETLRNRNPDVVPAREIDRLRNAAEAQRGALDAARAERTAIEANIATLLPAQRASAEAALAEAEVNLGQTLVVAGVAGSVEQFTLRPGDYVSALMRPAGVLIPENAGRRMVLAGFGQIEAQVLKVGMVGEIMCPARPFEVIPMVVVDVQEFIASGQVRLSDQLADAAAQRAPGTILVTMEPMFPGGLEGLPPGANCIANAYTSNHDRLQDPEIGALTWLALHAVDATAVVHAAIIRIQALLTPVRTLVLSGGH